jgi:hypothetical protein
MTFNPSSLPQDQPNLNKIPARTLFQGMLKEIFTGHSVADVLAEPRQSNRMALLLIKSHAVGRITLPIPNLVALQLIQQLDRADPLAFVTESIFILRNQTEEDVLFASGTDRDLAKARCLQDISAAQLPEALICVNELLDVVQKKTLNSLERMKAETADLMQQLSSSSSAKPMDNPSNTGSMN